MVDRSSKVVRTASSTKWIALVYLADMRFLWSTGCTVDGVLPHEKGVATYIGILLALAWPAATAFCLVWLAVAILTRYSSLATLPTSAGTPFVLWGIDQQPEAKLFALLTVLLWIMHSANISRLLARKEDKIGLTDFSKSV
jgi:hypothetical protein